MISISELYASYEGAEIIHGISADFPEGKITVLMGPNGCGKSTTLRSLLRMVPETSGSMTLNGQELEALAPQALARRIASSSAWAVASWRASHSLWARAMTSPPRAITQPTGISPASAASRAS